MTEFWCFIPLNNILSHIKFIPPRWLLYHAEGLNPLMRLSLLSLWCSVCLQNNAACVRQKYSGQGQLNKLLDAQWSHDLKTKQSKTHTAHKHTHKHGGKPTSTGNLRTNANKGRALEMQLRCLHPEESDIRISSRRPYVTDLLVWHFIFFLHLWPFFQALFKASWT